MLRWSVYMVRCKNGTLYTGITTQVSRRFSDHQSGSARGAKYLRGRGPLRLVFRRSVGPKGLALRLEARIKRLPKARKEDMIRGRLPIKRLLAAVGATHASPGRTARNRPRTA